ncbi:acyltransferase [Paenibacillus favisporus]|uniref:acyltransferase n=1 Tax=Paenibacillus favisporus TaxID=221028 RepID=UPI0013D2EDDF|nr:acyltransferase family protein [Paenibacillus favisporus]
MQNNVRNINFDLLRIIAIIGVIFLHVSSPLHQTFAEPIIWWHIGNVYDSAVRWTVPVFFMISGAFLLNKNEPINRFLKKRFSTILPSFFVWSVIYYFWEIKRQEDIGNIVEPSAKTFFYNFLNGNIYYHLWFIYTILGLYLVVPIIRLFVQNATKQHIQYFLLLWFFGNTVLTTLEIFLGIKVAIPLNLFTDYLGYMILGSYLNMIGMTKKSRIIIYTISLIAFLAEIYGTYFLSVVANKGIYSYYFHHPFSITNILISISIFIFFKHLNIKCLKTHTSVITISWLSGITLQVYFSHALVLDLLNQLSINNNFITPIFAVPITSFLIAILCYGVLSIIKYAYIKLRAAF